MANVLINKYEGSFTDESLPKFGELRITLKKKSGSGINYRMFGIASAVTQTISIENGYFVDSSGENPTSTKEITAGSSAKIVYVSNFDCTIIVPNKYELLYLGNNVSGSAKNYVIDEESLKYCTKLTGLELMECNLYTDLECTKLVSLTEATKLMTILQDLRLELSDNTISMAALNEHVNLRVLWLDYWRGIPDEGIDFTKLTGLKNLTTIYCYGNGSDAITGTYQDFCEAIHANGRISGTCDIRSAWNRDAEPPATRATVATFTSTAGAAGISYT